MQRSNETRMRISDSLKGHSVSSETRLKIGRANRGKHHGRCRVYSDEERALRHLIQSKQSRQNLKLQILRHYSLGMPVCQRCGITDIDILTVDHINGGGNKHIRALNQQGTSFYQWLKNQAYPVGFQVLCFNCNVKKRLVEGC